MTRASSLSGRIHQYITWTLSILMLIIAFIIKIFVSIIHLILAQLLLKSIEAVLLNIKNIINTRNSANDAGSPAAAIIGRLTVAGSVNSIMYDYSSEPVLKRAMRVISIDRKQNSSSPFSYASEIAQKKIGPSLYQQPILSPTKSEYNLVLDLDETLVHSTQFLVPSETHVGQYIVPDLKLEIVHKKGVKVFYVMKRPFVDVFLRVLSQYFEIVIFTASMRRYADPVIDMIDPNRLIKKRLFREACLRTSDKFVKNLVHVSQDMSKTIIIDNSVDAFNLNPQNGILIRPFLNNPLDTELLHCIPFLIALRCVEDVRSVLRRRRSQPFDVPLRKAEKQS